MARPRRTDRTINKHVKIPVDINRKLEYHLQDPLTGRVPPGEYSRLIERLLRRWVQEVEGGNGST